MKLVAILILLGLDVAGVGVALARHGCPKKGKENFWLSFFTGAGVFVLYYFTGMFEGVFA